MVFDHVGLRASDMGASERFYGLVLKTLEIEMTYSGAELVEWSDLALSPATVEHPATRRLHVAFVAQSRAGVDRFWQTGTDAGYRDDGAPGPRPQYGDDYYGGFLLDPDGNSAEAVHHGSLRQGGAIDHLWIRVADVAASKRFYQAIAGPAGLALRHDTPERARFAGVSGSFSVVADAATAPTSDLHIAFPAATDAFHAAAIAAGYRDNGRPGERRVYHPGYYGAFVLDPDGNNVELVNHNGGGG
jgi:catechol 2,3-dioxygenase-like lactoylglutathione lyase family enzyme